MGELFSLQTKRRTGRSRLRRYKARYDRRGWRPRQPGGIAEDYSENLGEYVQKRAYSPMIVLDLVLFRTGRRGRRPLQGGVQVSGTSGTPSRTSHLIRRAAAPQFFRLQFSLFISSACLRAAGDVGPYRRDASVFAKRNRRPHPSRRLRGMRRDTFPSQGKAATPLPSLSPIIVS